MASLQEQLLKAGLVDKKQAKQAKKDKKKQPKLKKGQQQVDESKVLAQQAIADKQAKDRELNQIKQQQAETKAIAAQIKQLIETNLIRREGGELAYQFADAGKIKKIYINNKLQQQILNGHVSIVRLNDGHELIPTIVAKKIEQRDANCIVELKLEQDVVDEDDPYKDYQIPDDLMW